LGRHFKLVPGKRLITKMYSLNGMGGRHFAFFAGDRSDFIVLRHPEYTLGRLGSEQGVPAFWDNRKAPHASPIVPNASATTKQLYASQRLGSPRLRGQEARKPPLKDRALARSKSASDVASSQVMQGNENVDSFIKALTAPGSLPSVHKNPHNMQCMSPATKHFMNKRDQLGDIKKALLIAGMQGCRDVDDIKRDLERKKSWQYHARSMQEVKTRASKKELIPDNLHPERDQRPVGIGRFNYNHPPPVPALADLKPNKRTFSSEFAQ